MATVVHGVMVGGLVAGVWDAGACIVGILLDSLAAYCIWLTIYLRRRGLDPRNSYNVARSFIGLSLGVWGFIAMFRSITLRDVSIIATSFAVLKYIDPEILFELVGGADSIDEVVFILVLLLAVWLLLVSLYFLAQILWAMPFGQLAAVVASVAAIRATEVYNWNRSGAEDDRIALAERNIAELALHVFVKGWLGALLIFLITFSEIHLGWAYLIWSYFHDLVLRPWVWSRYGPRLMARWEHRTRATAVPS